MITSETCSHRAPHAVQDETVVRWCRANANADRIALDSPRSMIEIWLAGCEASNTTRCEHDPRSEPKRALCEPGALDFEACQSSATAVITCVNCPKADAGPDVVADEPWMYWFCELRNI